MENITDKITEMRDVVPRPMTNTEVDNLRDRFMTEMTSFYETGELPRDGSKEVKFYLENQAERLKRKGIGIRKAFIAGKEDMSNDIVKSRSPYMATMSIRECEIDTTYVKGDKTLKKKRSGGSFLYCNVLQKEDATEDQDYVCPNCGHKALLSSFSDGCVMCGTKFEMPQRYPCVTNYYSIPQPVSRSGIQRVINYVKIAGIVGACGFWIYYSIFLIVKAHLFPLLAIFLGLLMGAFAGVAVALSAYMIFSACLLLSFIPMAIFAIVSTADMTGAMAAKKKTEAAMKKYDREFSYEFFEGRAMSILRATAFSSDRGSLGIYRGEDGLEYMDDIVNIELRGGMAFRKCVKYNDMLHLCVRAFTSNTYYKDDELKTRNDTFDLEFVRRPDAVSDIAASVHAVNCRSCGASFDAAKMRKCPHCSAGYELANEDWTLVYVKKVG